MAVLHPDVVLRVDRGKGFAQLPVEGPERVAGAVLERGRPFAPFARQALVNGAAGAVVGREGQLLSVVAFTVTDGKISTIDIVADPAKLSAVAASYAE